LFIPGILRQKRSGPVAIAAGLVTLAIAACGAPSTSGPVAGTLPAQIVNARTPKPSPTPYQFSFATVNDPASTTFTRVMGIDELNEVVGTFGTGSASDPSHGFNSETPYTKFRTLDYPSAVDTVATAMSSNEIFVGYFVDDSSAHHVWGFVRNKGVWTQSKDPKTPKGAGSVNEFLGVNNPGEVTGFYLNSYGSDAAYELVNNHFQALNPTGATTATANGINMRGIIVGTETVSGTTEGWLLENREYYTITYPGAYSTQALAINYESQVVGSYVDGTGTHGFILSDPTSPTGKYWQSIDEPAAAGTTVVTSINSKHAICGWYVDSNGNTDGFVATVEQ
jgi:hypothetical protein